MVESADIAGEKQCSKFGHTCKSQASTVYTTIIRILFARPRASSGNRSRAEYHTSSPGPALIYSLARTQHRNERAPLAEVVAGVSGLKFRQVSNLCMTGAAGVSCRAASQPVLGGTFTTGAEGLCSGQRSRGLDSLSLVACSANHRNRRRCGPQGRPALTQPSWHCRPPSVAVPVPAATSTQGCINNAVQLPWQRIEQSSANQAQDQSDSPVQPRRSNSTAQPQHVAPSDYARARTADSSTDVSEQHGCAAAAAEALASADALATAEVAAAAEATAAKAAKKLRTRARRERLLEQQEMTDLAGLPAAAAEQRLSAREARRERFWVRRPSLTGPPPFPIGTLSVPTGSKPPNACDAVRS